MAEEFIIPIDIDTSSLEAHLARIAGLIDDIGAGGSSLGAGAGASPFLQEIESALSGLEKLQAQLSHTGSAQILPFEQVQRFRGEISQLTTQLRALQETRLPTVAEAPAAVRAPNLTRPLVERGIITEAEANDPAVFRQVLARQPVAETVPPAGPSQKELSKAVLSARQFAKEEEARLAATIYSELDELEAIGISKPGTGVAYVDAKSDDRKGQRIAIPNKTDIPGGEYDFYKNLQEDPGKISRYERAGFLVPPGTGSSPDEVLNRIQNRVPTGQDPQEYLLKQYDEILRAKAASRVDISKSGTGLDPRLLAQGLESAGLTQEQITAEVLQAVAGKGSSAAVSRQLVGTIPPPAPEPPPLSGLEVAQQRAEAIRAARAAAIATPTSDESLFGPAPNVSAEERALSEKARLERQAELDRVRNLRFDAEQNLTPGRLAQPALEPVPAAAQAPGVNDASLKATSEASASELNLAKSLNLKIEALDRQRAAVEQAASAELRLAKAADAAATAKLDQRDKILKQTFPTEQPTSATDDTDQSASALERKAARDAAKANAIREASLATKAEAFTGPDIISQPAPGTNAAKVAGLDEARTKLQETLETADVQEVLARDETGNYAKAVARIRIAYERSSGNIAEVLLQNDQYATAVSRSKGLQAQLDAAINKRLVNEAGYTDALAASKVAQAEIARKTQEALAGNDQYIESLAVTKSLRTQEAAKVQAQLAADDEYIQATAAAANSRRLAAAETKDKVLAGVGLEQSPVGLAVQGPNVTAEERRAVALKALTQQEAENAAQGSVAKAEIELATIKEKQVVAQQRISEGLQTEEQLRAETTSLARQYNREQAILVANTQRAAYTALKASGAGPEDIGTKFQQFQSGIASREGSFKDPTQFLQLGQFLESRFLTTAGFAVSGVATYAAFSGIQKMIKDSAELERVLSQVRAQFNSLGQGDQLDSFRGGILGISRDTGTAAVEVLKLGAAFKGAFGQGAGGTLSNNAILAQTQSAVEFSKVTGVSLADITNNLIATAKSYGVETQKVEDVSVALSQRTNVGAKEIVDALGTIGPVADQAGISLDELSGFITAAAENSGRSASSIAENFARSLPEISKNALPLIQFFQSVSQSAGESAKAALFGDQPGKIIELIAQSYSHLSKNQQDYVLGLIGSKKDTQAFIAAFSNYPEVLRLIQAAQTSGGATAAAYGDLQQTLSQQLSRVGAGLKTIGESLLRLGLSQLLQDLAKSFGVVVSVASGFVSFLGDLNDAAGGVPGKLAAIGVELFGIYKILALLQGIAIGEGALGLLTGAGLKATILGGGTAAGLEGLSGAAAAAAGGGAAAGIGVPAAELGGLSAAAVAASARGGLLGAGATSATSAALGLGSLASLAAALDPSGVGIADLVTNLAGGSYGTKANPIEQANLGKFSASAPQLSRDQLLKTYLGNKDTNKYLVDTFETGHTDDGSSLSSLGNIQKEIKSSDQDAQTRLEYTALLEYRKRQIADKTVIINQLVKQGKIPKDVADKVLSSDNINDYTNALKGIPQPDISAAQSAAGTAAQTADKVGTQVKNTLRIEAQFLAGLIGPRPYLADLKKNRDDAKTNLEQALQNPALNPDQIKQFETDFKAADTAYSSAAKAITTANIAYGNLLTSLKGGDKGTTLLSNIANISSQIANVTDPTERLTLLQQFATAQQDLVTYLISKATSLSEAYKIAHTPIAIPPEIQTAIATAAITQNSDINDTLVTLADASGVPVTKFLTDAARFAAAGKNARDELLKVAEQRVQEAIAQAEALTKLGKDDVNLDNFINKMLTAIGALEEGPGGKALANLKTPKTTTPDPNQDYSKQKAVGDSLNAIAQAQANGDPFALANAAKDKAARDAQAASYLPAGPDRIAALNQAQAEGIAANNQQVQATQDLAKAKLAVLAAQVSDNPLQAAQVALAQAEQQVQSAHSEAERLQGIASEITAQHALRDAMNAIADAQQAVVVALLGAAGDTVGAAKATLKNDQADLARYLQQHPGSTTSNDVAASGLFQKTITDQAAARDALLQKQEADIQFQLDINKISTAQAIPKLQNLLATANITEAERQQIERQIYQLKQSLTKDLQFNLPSDLKLPTLYEARRVNQQGGLSNYNDNRQITITLTSNSKTDANAAVNTIVKAINEPPRVGIRPHTY